MGPARPPAPTTSSPTRTRRSIRPSEISSGRIVWPCSPTPPTPTYFGAENVTAAKVSLINRVTHVYEAETSIRLVLIANNDVLNLDTAAQMTGQTVPAAAPPASRPRRLPACGRRADADPAGDRPSRRGFELRHRAHRARLQRAREWPRLGVVGGNNKAMGCTGLATAGGRFVRRGLRGARDGPPVRGQPHLQRDVQSCGGPAIAAPAIPSSREAGPRSWPTPASARRTTSSPTRTPTGRCAASTRSRTTRQAERAPTSTTSRWSSLTGFDGTDSFQLRYNGSHSAPIVRGTNFTHAGVQAAIQGIPGWPAGGTVTCHRRCTDTVLHRHVRRHRWRARTSAPSSW